MQFIRNAIGWGGIFRLSGFWPGSSMSKVLFSVPRPAEQRQWTGSWIAHRRREIRHLRQDVVTQ